MPRFQGWDQTDSWKLMGGGGRYKKKKGIEVRRQSVLCNPRLYSNVTGPLWNFSGWDITVQILHKQYYQFVFLFSLSSSFKEFRVHKYDVQEKHVSRKLYSQISFSNLPVLLCWGMFSSKQNALINLSGTERQWGTAAATASRSDND